MQVDQFLAHHTAEETIAAVAGRLVVRLVELTHDGTTTSLVCSRGETTTAVLDHILNSLEHTTVDWSLVDIYVSDDHWEAHLKDPVIENFATKVGARFHPLPDSRHYSAPEEGANAFAIELGLGSSRMPVFDLALLDIGPRASLAGHFPEHPSLHDNRWMTAARGADVLITMSVPLLSNCDEIWLLATGEQLQEAVRLTLSERAGLKQAPSAALRGKYRTLLLTDVAAAGEVADAARLASP